MQAQSSTLFHCHDYQRLVRRWRKVARDAGLQMTAFAQAGGYEVLRLTSRKSVEGGVYLSAGIHGDEPAATEGLICWAEANPELLRKTPCVIFPCLNPWGLVNNSRFDEQGRDLNRTFQHDHVPHLQALKAFLKPLRFRLALNLHEDYDGHGLYIYELERHAPFWGEELIEIARTLIPIESRTLIDTRRVSKPGLLRRKIDIEKFTAIPEAIYLHHHHAERTFTFETPSEFALEQRVRVQVALIDACLRR
ncbi:MAG: M14 family metallocarboxypeptidase [Verrucomicrobiota bacterium]